MRLASCAAAAIALLGVNPQTAQAQGNRPYWQLRADGPLTFMPRESDASLISLTCLTRGRLLVEIPLFEDEKGRPVQLKSGDLSRTYKAKVVDDELYGALAQVRTTTKDPLIVHFRATHELGLSQGRDLAPLAQPEIAAIDAFFARCR